jgi:hypothetical protein
MSITHTDVYEEQSSLIDPDRKVEVYRNLHKRCWSVRQGGLVKFHCHTVNLKSCSFVVQPAGRAKVVRDKRKNVHAFVRGNLCDLYYQGYPSCLDNIYYNPYKADTFLDFEDKPVYKADFVDFDIKDKRTPLLASNPV